MITLIIFLTAFLAFSISLICGGGAGPLLIPIIGFSLPVSQVPAALSVGTSVSSITKIWLFYKNIQWQMVRIFLPAALPGVFLGVWMLSHINPVYVEFFMALFLIANLPQLFLKTKADTAKKSVQTYKIGIVGFLAGFISGLTGAVGVLFNGFYMRSGLNKEAIIATRAANELILHVIKLILYAMMGLLTLKALKIGIIIAVAAIISTWIMKSILPRISVKLFSRLGYAAMALAGLLMLNSSIVRINIEKNPEIKLDYLAKGVDTSITWGELIYSVEFRYEEGFEFERIVPLSTLSLDKQALVMSKKGNAAKIVVEKVYQINKVTYEAYYYNLQDRLIYKFDL